jgi:hypothetical protein
MYIHWQKNLFGQKYRLHNVRTSSVKMKMCGCISVHRPDKSCEDIPLQKSRGVRNPLMSKNGDDEWDSQRDRKGDGQ